MVRTPKKRKSPTPAALCGPPPRGGVQKGPPKRRVPGPAKENVATSAVATSHVGPPQTRSIVRASAATFSPKVPAGVSHHLLVKLRTAQAALIDHEAEMTHVWECINTGRRVVEKSDKKVCVLSATARVKIVARMETARARQEFLEVGHSERVRKCEKARVDCGGKKTSSTRKDPPHWDADKHTPKCNRWPLAGGDNDAQQEEDAGEEKESVDGDVDDAADDSDENQTLNELASRAEASSSARSPSNSTDRSGGKGVSSNALVQILHAAQKDYFDDITELKAIQSFRTSGDKQFRLAKKGGIELSESMHDTIQKRITKAIARRLILQGRVISRQAVCENARQAAGGEKTVSVENDPPDWATFSFKTKRNEWVVPTREYEEEEKDGDEDEESTVASIQDSSDSSSDSGDESESSNDSGEPVSEEVRLQRIANTRRFYALNRARWQSGDLDDETWLQFGCDDDSSYLN